MTLSNTIDGIHAHNYLEMKDCHHTTPHNISRTWFITNFSLVCIVSLCSTIIIGVFVPSIHLIIASFLLVGSHIHPSCRGLFLRCCLSGRRRNSSIIIVFMGVDINVVG